MEKLVKEDLYFIRVFDDGNQKYKNLINEWLIYSILGHGKVSLININGKDKINSISAWKINSISDFKCIK
jgi:hypothetical protein